MTWTECSFQWCRRRSLYPWYTKQLTDQMRNSYVIQSTECSYHCIVSPALSEQDQSMKTMLAS